MRSSECRGLVCYGEWSTLWYSILCFISVHISSLGISIIGRFFFFFFFWTDGKREWVECASAYSESGNSDKSVDNSSWIRAMSWLSWSYIVYAFLHLLCCSVWLVSNLDVSIGPHEKLWRGRCQSMNFVGFMCTADNYKEAYGRGCLLYC